jgi:hypothetical protein
LPVAEAERASDRLAEFGSHEGLLQLVGRAFDRRVETDPRDRDLVRALRSRQRDRSILEVGVENVAGTDLVPVVILRIDPEHRHGRHAVLGCDAGGELDRRDGFEQREERTAEESGLLAGDDGDGARIAQARRGLFGGFGRSAGAELRHSRAGHLIALPRMSLCPRDCGAPRLRRGRASGEERLDAWKVPGVLAREPPDPREPPHVDRDLPRLFHRVRMLPSEPSAEEFLS